jgi:hypothetical protein
MIVPGDSEGEVQTKFNLNIYHVSLVVSELG